MKHYYSHSTGGFYRKGINTIPADAVAITDDMHSALLAGLSSGYVISLDDSGSPVLANRGAAERREKAVIWIDDTADRIRASDRSIGQYLDAEYQLVAQALVEYRTNPEGEVPDAIRSYATAEGLTVEAAAQQIAEAAARAQELLQDVRRIRLAGKAAIRDAGDDADFMETARPYIDQLEAVTTKMIVKAE